MAASGSRFLILSRRRRIRVADEARFIAQADLEKQKAVVSEEEYAVRKILAERSLRAVSAGAGSAAGIAYLDGGGYTEISHTLVNALAIASGMVCDGAKPSCAAKITMAVGAGLLGYEMYMHEQQFCQGEGLVAADVEKTIANIGRLGREGMQETEREILQMMLE